MAIRIERQHSLGKDEAKKRVDKIRTEVASQYGLSTSWQGDELNVSGAGVNGKISVDAERVLVDIRLGFAMMMMEGPIKSHISATMDRHLV